MPHAVVDMRSCLCAGVRTLARARLSLCLCRCLYVLWRIYVKDRVCNKYLKVLHVRLVEHGVESGRHNGLARAFHNRDVPTRPYLHVHPGAGTAALGATGCLSRG